MEAGSTIEPLVRNIDIAPTMLDLAGVKSGRTMDGRSFLPLLEGKPGMWNSELLYEYYWEDAFPHTPTVLSLRDGRYKYIYYHGVWDDPELFDLTNDPLERHNLARDPAQAERVSAMRTSLFDQLSATGGMQIPLRVPTGWRADLRRQGSGIRDQDTGTLVPDP